MGRKRKNAVYSYFSYDKSKNKSMCLVPGCSSEIKGQHGTNLMYHLSSKHEDEFKVVQRRNELIADDSADKNNENDRNIANTSTNNAPTNNRLRSRLDKLKRECVNLVTIHGRPFTMLEDKAFKNILAFTTFPQQDLQSINAHSIRELVKKTANEKRNELALELKDKLVCIKVDGATCLDRMFLGINVQYIEYEKIIIKNIGVCELHARSTSEFLKEKLLFVLRKYNLSIDQIYSITTDNGSNMLKLTRLLNEDICSDDSDEDEDVSQSTSSELVITLNERVAEDPNRQYSITSIRCAAHMLQLALNDALREDEAMPIIEDARCIVRRLRTPTMKNILKAGNKKKPILDCTTRWHSTLDMLERLQELRDYCSTIAGDPLYMAEVSWHAISDMVTALTPAKVLTKNLQSEQLTLCDFFYFWTKCYLDTAKINIPLAQYICMHMEIRKQYLMQNNGFISALFLDPRFQIVLSGEEMAAAISHITRVWVQLLKVEARSMNNIAEPLQGEISEAEQSEDEIETLLALTERNRRSEEGAMYVQSHSNISSILGNFSKHPRLNHKENILQFWAKKKFSDPQLYRLAHIILATPATQVSVERLFSSLKFVLSSLRYNLSDEIVEDILVLRNNLHD